jgi:hypothetical protein
MNLTVIINGSPNVLTEEQIAASRLFQCLAECDDPVVTIDRFTDFLPTLIQGAVPEFELHQTEKIEQIHVCYNYFGYDCQPFYRAIRNKQRQRCDVFLARANRKWDS